jgi:hypothetical protein
MATAQPIPLVSQPGIKQDSTIFEGQNYTGGEWCRFNARALPRKIAGFTAVTQDLPEIVRAIESYTSDATNYLHLGSTGHVLQVQTDLNGTPGSMIDRTPAAYVPDANTLWMLDQFYNKVGGSTYIIAHPGKNLTDIAATAELPFYYGTATAGDLLVASGMDPVSGGVMALPPFFIGFSNQGRVDVSAINDPTQPNQSSFVTDQKIVCGLPLPGSSGPSALLWSLDALILLTFDASITTGIPFDFSTVSDSVSILSSRSVIEFDSIYYWVGVDRFMLYNGVVRELPNNLNIDFFFKNLNFTYRQKVFAFKVPRWGEIWWCFPFGNSQECNHAVIYNTRLNIWYDTALPDGGRSAALFAKVFQRPFMCDVDATPTGYTLWQHEIGVDKVTSGKVYPVRSSFTTHTISPLSAPQPMDKAFRVSIIEPDFNQVGSLRMTLYGRANTRVGEQQLALQDFPQPPVTAQNDQLIEIKAEQRLLRFKFESNVLGGDYEFGRAMVHIEPTTGRFTQ